MGRRRKSDEEWGCAIFLVITFVILAKIGGFFSASTDIFHNAMVGGAIVLGIILLPIVYKALDGLLGHWEQRRKHRKSTISTDTGNSVIQARTPEYHDEDQMESSEDYQLQSYLEAVNKTDSLRIKRYLLEKAVEHDPHNASTQSKLRDVQQELRQEKADKYLQRADQTENLEQKCWWLEQALEYIPDSESIQGELADVQERLRWEREEQEERLRALKLADVDHLKGVDFEHYVGKLLTHQGFQVEVTTSSGDFGVDLIAARDGNRWAVQCKRQKSPVSLKAVQEAVTGRLHYDCDGAMVVTNNTFTSSAAELAESAECKLIGRDALADWIRDFQMLRESSEQEEPSEDDNVSQLAMF